MDECERADENEDGVGGSSRWTSEQVGLSGANKSFMEGAGRILVIRYRFIGDTILTVPFLRNLRAACPDATIDVLVGPQSGSVLANCPYVDELITFDTTRFHKYDSGAGSKKSFFHYASLLRKRRYDTVFVLKRSLSSAALAFLTGADRRIGYATAGRGFLLTRAVNWNKHVHEVDSLLSVLEAAEIEVNDRSLEAFPTNEERTRIESMVPDLATDRPRLLIHAAAAHPDKMYPLQSWSVVLRTLVEQHGYLPFFTGAERDYELYFSLAGMAGVDGVNLAGKLTLRESMALYERMSLAVCVDSGPAHLAAAAGVPTVSIFGPTDPERWKPYGEMHRAVFDRSISCSACAQKKELTEHHCLLKLAPVLVLRAVDELIEDKKDRCLTSASP